MRPGPLPLPTAVKQLRGTLRADRINPKEPQSRALTRAPKAPAWLSPRARAAWARLVPVVLRMRVLADGDQELLALLAHQLAVYEQAAESLAGKDALTFVVMDGDGNPKAIAQWPEIKIAAAASAECRRLAEHFGMSPASRGRVSAVGGSAEAPDPFAEFDAPHSVDQFINRRRAGSECA